MVSGMACQSWYGGGSLVLAVLFGGGPGGGSYILCFLCAIVSSKFEIFHAKSGVAQVMLAIASKTCVIFLALLPWCQRNTESQVAFYECNDKNNGADGCGSDRLRKAIRANMSMIPWRWSFDRLQERPQQALTRRAADPAAKTRRSHAISLLFDAGS